MANLSLAFIGLTHLVLVLETIFTTQAQESIIDHFSCVDQIFATKLNMKTSYEKENRCIFIHILILVSTTIFIHLSVTTYLVYRWKIYSFLYNTNLSKPIITFRQIQIFFCVYLIQLRLYRINSKLSEFQNASQIDSDQSKHLIFDQMLCLKQIFHKLSNICDLMNITFGWSLLITTVYVFAKITMTFYWAFIDLPNIENLIVNFSLFSPKLLTLFTIALYCSSCKRSVG